MYRRYIEEVQGPIGFYMGYTGICRGCIGIMGKKTEATTQGV